MLHKGSARRKPIKKRSLGGPTYLFGFITSQRVYRSEHNEYKTTRAFIKQEISRNDAQGSVSQFLYSVRKGNFWLMDGKELMSWENGKPLHVTIKGAEHHIGEELEVTKDDPSYLINKATYVISPHRMTFTDLVRAYIELTSMESQAGGAQNWFPLLHSLKVAIYQYLYAAGWKLRFQVLRILKEEEFGGLTYRHLKEVYFEMEAMKWKFTDMKSSNIMNTLSKVNNIKKQFRSRQTRSKASQVLPPPKKP